MADISLDMEAMGVGGPVEVTEEMQTKAKCLLRNMAKDTDDEKYLLIALGLAHDPEAKPVRHGK